jgi:hypothetical protein
MDLEVIFRTVQNRPNYLNQQMSHLHRNQYNTQRCNQGCILLTYLNVFSSKFIQKFAQKCQYFILIYQSVPPDNCYVTCLLREKSALDVTAGNILVQPLQCRGRICPHGWNRVKVSENLGATGHP